MNTFCFREENHDVLCVADWGQTLSFYTLGGKLVTISKSTLKYKNFLFLKKKFLFFKKKIYR